MSDGRPLSNITPTDVRHREHWALVAALNLDYARRRDYGFVLVQPIGNRCPHPMRGPRRVHAWCKIPAVASAIRHGIFGRACDNVLFLDSDAIVANMSLSVDAYLARARDEYRDEALTSDSGYPEWLLLMASDYWFDADEPNTGVFFVRGGEQHAVRSCGLLRYWWEYATEHLETKRPWEQGAMMRMHMTIQHRPHSGGGDATDGDPHATHSPFGALVRLMPTARFFDRDDAQWRYPFVGAWAVVANGSHYSRDDFIHHGERSVFKLEERLAHRRIHSSNKALLRLLPHVVRLNASDLVERAFGGGDAACDLPLAMLSPGTRAGFNSDWRTMWHGPLSKAFNTTRRNASHARLDGSTTEQPRPCWRTARGSAWVARMVEWACR